MSERPNLDNNLDSKTFKEYYYLKEELIDFCRRNDLQITGGKLELIERISHFLDTGKGRIKLILREELKLLMKSHLIQ